MGAGDAYLLGAMATFLIPWPLVVLAFLCAVALGTVGGLTSMWLASRTAPDEPRSEEAAGAADLDPSPQPATDSPADGSATYAAAMDSPAPADEPFSPSPENPAEGDAVGAGMPRGAAGMPGEEPGERPMPECPRESRWGRVWTVLGTWIVLGALWGGAILFESNRVLGIAAAAGGLAAAAALLRYGIRLWLAGDHGSGEEGSWHEAMEEHFEEDPGPRTIAFGPYLVVGTLIAMFLGQQILTWYVSSPWGLNMSVQDLAWLKWD
jgi:hypothetical protein